MKYSSNQIATIITLVVLLIFNFKDVFCSSVNDIDNADSLKVYQLIDSITHENIHFEKAMKIANKAMRIADQSKCKSCVAVSILSKGTIFYDYSIIDSAIYYFNNALNKYKNIEDTTHLSEIYYHLSKSYSQIYDFDKSLKYAKLGLALTNSQVMNSKIADYYLIMGSDYMDLGMQKEAIQALINALTIFETEHDSTGITSTLINIGLVFAIEDNFIEALKYTNRALLISRKINYNIGISVCLNNIGYFYSRLGEHEKALSYYQRSLELYKSRGDKEGVAVCLNNIGDSYRDLHDTTLAVSYYTKSLNIGELNNYSVVITTLINLGEINLSWGNLKVALSFANRSVELAESINTIDDILAAYNLLYRCYAAMGNYEKAYNYSSIYKQLYDSTYSIAKSKQIQEVISRYNDQQQKTEIVNLKKQSTDDFIFRVYLIKAIIAISLALITLFVAIIFIRRSKNIFKSQKKYYEKLLERSEDFIFVIGKDGLTKYISPSYQRKIGRSLVGRVSKDTFELIHPDDVTKIKQEFSKLVSDGKSRTMEFRISDASNNWLDVYAYGQNLFDDPLIQGIVVNFWDITHHKKSEKLLKKSEIRFRQIFNAFPDIYFQTDLNGIITEVSPSVKKIIGYSSDEIIGVNSKEFHTFIGDWRRIESKYRIDSFVNDFDTKITKKDGTYLHCSLTAEQTYSYDGSPTGIKGVIRDISTRIVNHKRLRDSQNKLKEANKSKEMLFSIIAHDLIGPIGTNKSIVDMIVDQIDEFSHEEIVTLITSLKPSLDTTFSLIENLLSWSRIQQNSLKPNFEELSINNLVNEIVQLLVGQAQLKLIELNIVETVPLTVVADKNQLDVALRNLVSNAIKFSHKNSEIIISIAAEDDMVVIKITDFGIGMNSKQLNEVIAKGGSTSVIRGTNNEKGTGFGLIIVNEFIKNNNGHLNAISKVGEGTTFIVKLPLKNNI